MSDRSQSKLNPVLVLFIVCVLLFVGAVSAVPISKFTADPQIGEAPLTVTFAETSGDATIVNWQWDFGDGTAILDGKDSKPFTHVFEIDKEYTVKLTVTNDKSEKASASQTITVSKPASTATLTVVGTGTIALKPISAKGIVSAEPVDIKSLSLATVTVASIEITKDMVVTTKTVQIFPEAKVQVSENTETVMQSSTTGNAETHTPVLELYYGYEKSKYEPWQYYYRVDDISKNPCRVVRADFATKRVWIEYVDPAAITAIVNAGTIPAYGALP